MPRPVRALRRPSRGHLHDEHGDVVVLFMTGHHLLDQVVDQPLRVIDHLGWSLRRHRDQLIESGVKTALAVFN